MLMEFTAQEIDILYLAICNQVLECETLLTQEKELTEDDQAMIEYIQSESQKLEARLRSQVANHLEMPIQRPLWNQPEK